MDFIELKSKEELEQYMKDKGVKPIEERPLSDAEKAAMEEAKRLGADGIANSPVSIQSVFNYINSVRFGGKGIFARIETASETSKYETGSQILSIYSSANKVFTFPEHVHGRKLVEMQFENGDYMCTDAETPYRPQPAYYSLSFSKASLIPWKKLGDFSSYTTSDFVVKFLIELRNILFEDMCQAMDAIALSYATIEAPITTADRKRTFKQISNELEKHSKKSVW